MSGQLQGPLLEEDFGGEIASAAPRKTREEIREEKFERGECRECSRPVVVKPNGRRLRLCEEHARADRDRKPKKGAADAS